MTTIRFAVAGGTDEKACEIRAFSNPDLKPLPQLLVSYYYYSKFASCKDRLKYDDWVMDSGAFSAWNSGATIDLDRYIEFCHEMKAQDPRLTEIYALDVIGDCKAGIKNWEKMKEAGIDAIPCFHIEDPFDALEYIARDSKKIAVGGLVGMHNSFKFKKAWTAKVFNKIWPKKIHAFGVSSERMIFSFPFHSVDSTSWTSPGRWGRWQYFNAHLPIRGSTHKLELEVIHFLEMQERARFRWAKQMQELEQL